MIRVALVAVLALSFCGCGFFKDPKEPSESVLHGNAQRSGLPPNAASMTAEQWLELSLEYYRQERYMECIAAAQTALFLEPGLPEAHNNIGVAYSQLHLWDLAIQAEIQALLLKPDFELAKRNLAWAQTQKQNGVK